MEVYTCFLCHWTPKITEPFALSWKAAYRSYVLTTRLQANSSLIGARELSVQGSANQCVSLKSSWQAAVNFSIIIQLMIRKILFHNDAFHLLGPLSHSDAQWTFKSPFCSDLAIDYKVSCSTSLIHECQMTILFTFKPFCRNGPFGITLIDSLCRAAHLYQLVCNRRQLKYNVTSWPMFNRMHALTVNTE